MSYKVRKGLNIYCVETYRNLATDKYYFTIEQSCTCACGNEHTNTVYDSGNPDDDEDEVSYDTVELAIDAGEKYINENEEL